MTHRNNSTSKRFALRLAILLLCLLATPLWAQKTSQPIFSAAEQQQISIATPGLFNRSQAFSIDFSILGKSEYCFPLPVGKAQLINGNSTLEITTKPGDAVKAMFDGTVRLSRHVGGFGNVIVLRHDNGLETVYGDNAQNLVKVGQHVNAGQTIAIVGSKDGKAVCIFSIMVNGARINPSTILEVSSHRLRQQTIVCEKRGSHVNVTVRGTAQQAHGLTLDPDEEADPFKESATFRLDLSRIAKEHWSYPLPGSHIISPYGGRRKHAGVDLKTKPKDNVLAAFDGIVTQAGPYYGYGNCIVIRHAFGFETLYSHQYRNLVKKGQKVKAGDVIGLTGRTGRATTEHLHFEIHFKGRRLNPNIIFNHTKRQLQAHTLELSRKGSVRKSN